MDWLFLLPLAAIGLAAWLIVRSRPKRRRRHNSGDVGTSHGGDGSSSGRHHDSHSGHDSGGGDSGGGSDGGGGGD